MTICPLCQTENEANIHFCSNCGVRLDVTEDRETDPVGEDKAKWAGDSPKMLKLPDSFAVSPAPVTLKFKIKASNREVNVLLENKIRIGRSDPSLDLFPELDVTRDGPTAKSVSRRHAVIIKEPNQLIIVDAGSSNGTFVNGKKLKAYAHHPLNSGDVIQFGRLLVDVKF